MNHRTERMGPNWGLLLLVPVAVILAKGAMHRRAMWESARGPSVGSGHGYGHHAGFAEARTTADGRTAFRLPPKIEWILDSWHTRAHQTADSPEPPII